MKKYIFALFFTYFLLPAGVVYAQTAPNVEIDLAPGETDEEPITLNDQVNTVLEVGRYFELNYPGNLIEEDLSQDVSAFFPHLTQQEVYEREQTIRDGIKFFRYFRDTYNDIKAKFLAPEEPPLIVDENEYDDQTSDPYIDAGDDQVVVISDFKKVLSYGPDNRDYKAYKAHKERQAEQKGIPDKELDKLGFMFSKFEWRKLPFYGIFYPDPVAGKQGGSAWFSAPDNKDVQIRLLAENTTLNNQPEIRGVIHLKLPEGMTVPAQNDGTHKPPQFDFSASSNLETASVFRPLPQRFRFDGKEDLIAYGETAVFPVIFKVKDPAQPLDLKLEADFEICREGQECRPLHLSPQLALESGNGYKSVYDNFIVQNFNFLPSTQSDALSVQRVIEEPSAEGKPAVLRVEFKLSGNPAKPDIFVQSDENIKFSRPRIAIDGDRLIARMDILTPGAELKNKEIEISAVLNLYDTIRGRYEVEKVSVLDFMPNSLSLGLVLMAILGGFILNFMPCVFPVLSLKLLSLTKFGALRERNIRRSFLLTVAGIILSFLGIASLLALLKYLGHSIGWGMQFQNSVFVVCMAFIVTLFIAQVKGWFSIGAPEWLNRLLFRSADEEGFLHFFTGVLVVIMATPCTAPYLGTTIGFALAGSTTDIYVILTAVAIGLSLPYLLLALVPDLSAFMPKPGPWMAKLNSVMVILLFLTLVWLISILWVQSGAVYALRVIFYLFLFIFLVWLRSLASQRLEVMDEAPEVKAFVFRWVRIIFWGLSLLLIWLALWDVNRGFTLQQQQNLQTKASKIDYAEIGKAVSSGRTVIVSIGADWCLTCTYNDTLVFSNIAVKSIINRYNIKLIEVDWTSYDPEVLAFMERFGRKGLPFYVLFSPNIPEGMLLPEVLNERELTKILKNIAE